MLHVALLLLSLTGLGASDAVEAECDRECHIDLTRAAAEWALEVIENHESHDFHRTFLDIGPVVGQDSSGDKVAAYAQVARELGTAVRDKRSTSAWRRCMEDATSAPCRAATGTTFITLKRLRFPVAGHAELRVEILILGGFGTSRNWSYGRVSRIHLVHEDGAWKFLDEEVLSIT